MVHTFQDGLLKTLQAIVLLSGTLQPAGQRGELCVSSPWSSDGVFQVKDLRHEVDLDYEYLRTKYFPLEALDRDDLVPLASHTPGEKTKVMLVQLNIIKGGMVMVLCVHHSFTDGMGTLAIARVWAAFCKGKDGSRLATQIMLNRDRVMQGWGAASLDDVSGWTTIPDRKEPPARGIFTYVYSAVLKSLSSFIHKWTPTTQRMEEKVPAQYQCEMFFFSRNQLNELKSIASSYTEVSNTWISTSDALCALLACCVHSSIGERERVEEGQTCSIVIVVGGRKILNPPLPADYVGNIMGFASVTMPTQSITPTNSGVADMAHLIRDQIEQRDERYLQKMIAALASVKDISRVIPSPPLPSEHRLAVSSWANQGLYDLDWGDAINTRIESVRCCLRANDFCVILPELSAPTFQDDERGLEIVVRLEKEQMERLKQDELFMKFAQYK